MSQQQEGPPSSAGEYNFFGYYPNLPAGLIFIIAFTLLLVVHVYLAVKSRVWWTSVTVIGILGEIIGWAGRIAAHWNPFGLSLYLLQQITLGISPIFFSATCYTLLGIQIIHIDPEMSYIPPKFYVIYFIIVDIVSLAIQGAGGGMSGAAAATLSSPETGSWVFRLSQRWIFFGGIIFQLVNMVVFTLFAIDYFRRMRKCRPEKLRSALTRPMWTSIVGMFIASALIILRNTYRAVEMGTGFTGWVAHHESLFDTLDALPMWLCVLTLAFCHPLYTFNRIPKHITSLGTPADKEKTNAQSTKTPSNGSDRTAV